MFVTALYTFRMMFMTFHGPERFRDAHAEAGHEAAVGADPHAEHDPDHGAAHDPHESPRVVTLPLIALAIPSVLIGALTVGSVLFGGYFGSSILVLAGQRRASASSAREFAGRAAGVGCRACSRCRSRWRSPAPSPPGCASCGGRRSPRDAPERAALALLAC